jgi:TonB family protein
MLNFHPSKPVEPFKTTHPRNATNNSLPTPNKQIRVFQPPVVKSSNSNPSQFPTAPEITFDPGTPNTFEAAHVFDVLVRTLGPAALPKSPVKAETKEHVVVVGGNVQAAKLIRQVQPIYPALARQIRVQGMVTLEAIIATDGTVQQLRVLNGHPLLAPSAVQTVQQWMYSPTVLNGKAVEVKTTIEVRFAAPCGKFFSHGAFCRLRRQFV